MAKAHLRGQVGQTRIHIHDFQAAVELLVLLQHSQIPSISRILSTQDADIFMPLQHRFISLAMLP